MYTFWCRSVPMTLSTNSSPSQLVPAPQPQSELDKMFSGLGLDSFMGGNEKNVTSKTPQVNGNVNSSTSLSLQDKQRYIVNKAIWVRQHNNSSSPLPMLLPQHVSIIRSSSGVDGPKLLC
jgi:hypothetical protein